MQQYITAKNHSLMELEKEKEKGDAGNQQRIETLEYCLKHIWGVDAGNLPKIQKKKVSVMVFSAEKIFSLALKALDTSLLKIAVEDFPKAKIFFVVVDKDIFESTVLKKEEKLSASLIFIHPDLTNVQRHLGNSPNYIIHKSSAVKKFQLTEKANGQPTTEKRKTYQNIFQMNFDTIEEQTTFEKKFWKMWKSGDIDRELAADARNGNERAITHIRKQVQKEVDRDMLKIHYGQSFEFGLPDDSAVYEVAGWKEYNRYQMNKWASGSDVEKMLEKF